MIDNFLESEHIERLSLIRDALIHDGNVDFVG